MGAQETEFMKNPINFLRKYSFSPPDGSPGDVIREWDVTHQGNILSGGHGINSSKVKLKSAGVAKKWCTFKRHGLLPGAKTVELSDRRSAPPPPNLPKRHPTLQSSIPIWWLPWETLSVVKIKIPPVPTSLVDPEENQFPRFFMTAGINGCSVFVEGPADAPSIYHAGISGKLARPSDEFWVEQLAEAHRGTVTPHVAHKAIHSKDYMGNQRAVVQKFEDWKNSARSDAFRLEITSCFGSVIGVRFGRRWSFYLQENAYIQDVQILKSNQVQTHSRNGGGHYYTDKESGSQVQRGEDQHSPRTFLGTKIGTKTRKTFLRRTNQRCLPLCVGEIYPTKTFTADFRTQIAMLA